MDKDIQEMFNKKNREILISNLKLDIYRNVEVLNNTIVNIFDKEFDTAIKNISMMYEDSNFDESIKKVDTLLDTLKLDIYVAIDNIICEKKNKLLKFIIDLDFEENMMEEYYNLVFSTTDDVINIFQSNLFDIVKKKFIDKFCKYTESKVNNNVIDITNSRINDYITYRLFGKIKDRIRDELLIRDNNLINKGKESYLKYKELQSKTANL